MDGNVLAINSQDIEELDSHYVKGEQKQMTDPFDLDIEELDSHYVRGEQKQMTDPFKCMKWLKMHSYINVIPFQDRVMQINMRLEYLQFIMKRWPNRHDMFSNVHETIKRIGINIHEACVHTKNEKLDSALLILKLVLRSGLNGAALQREVEDAHKCLNYSNIYFEAEDTEINPPFYSGMSFFPQGVKDTNLVAEFVDTLVQKLTYLVSFGLDDMTSQIKEVKSFEVKLKLLRGFLWFTCTCYIKFHGLEDLFARVRFLLDQAACIYYWCYVGKLTPNMEYEMIRTMYRFRENMRCNEAELRDKYLIALKASQSPSLDTHVPHSSKLVVSVADSLVDNFMELADKGSRSEVPTALRNETISHDLNLLITLLSGLRREFADNIIELKDLVSYVKDQCDRISLNSTSVSLGQMDKDLLRQVRGMIKIMEVEFSLIDLQNSISNSSMVNQKGEIQILYEELKSFTTLLFNLPGQREWDTHSRHIEALYQIFETVIRSYNMELLNEDADKKSSSHNLFELSVKVKLIKAEVNLSKLMKNQIIQVDLVKDNIENLVGDVEFLGNLLLDLPEQYDEHERRNDLISSVNVVAGEIDSIVESLCRKTSDEEVAGKINIQLSDVLQKIKLIKISDRESCPKFPKLSKANFPITDGLGFLDFLIEYLVETLESNYDRTFLLKHNIEIVQRELAFLREFLEKFKEQHNEYEELRSLKLQIVSVAYEVEYVVDSYVSNGAGTIWYHMLSDILEEIRRIKENVTKFSEYERITHSVGDTVSFNSMSQQTEKPKLNEVVVGFEDVLGKLKGKVIGGTSNLDVISIVGMPGLGKTTVAKKLYLDCKADRRFDLCSWCYISQLYEWKQVLIELLQQIIELPNKVEEKSVQDLATLLHQSVIGKRYLIFMDDIWTPDAWDELRSPFKDDNKSSRIILTTRNVEVALYAKCFSEPEHLRWFNEKEGWMLLRQKLFQDQESCPQKFVDVGKQIVKKCHGLPLSIVLVAGFLGKMEIREDKWLQVAESLSSYGIGDSNSRDIIELSYKHLPEYLKPCFLYLGRFMEDEEISVSKLIWLWIAEGLVRKHIKKSLEDVAQEYLVDLISRSLLMGAKKRHTGAVKACQLHDLLHEFCRSKAEEELFWQDLCSVPNAGFQDLEKRRITLCSDSAFSSLKRPLGFPVRSLLVNAPSKTGMISIVCFRLLKVLDLERVDLWDNFPKEVELLIHLRYLAVRTGVASIPRWIDKLAYLETLLVKGLRGEVNIPDTVWNMVRLRHVHINDRASFNLSEEIIDKSLELYDLETLSTPSLVYGHCMHRMMRKFSNLKRLRCMFVESSADYSMKLRKKIIRFPTLDFLVHLESLKVFSNGKKLLHPCEFKLPENLKKLTLSNFRLPWKEISAIAKLSSLEVLKLLLKAFEGEKWQVTDDEFPALKMLKLDHVSISQWDVSDDAFPSLEKLVLHRCKELKEIPSSFGYNTSLESIEVSWCSISVTDSAKQIQKTQIDELAKDVFKIFI